MKFIKFVLIIFLISGINSCKTAKKEVKMERKTISKKAIEVRNTIKKDIVIAHRGSTYWTPEETEPAFRWARNIGADYLELDVQLTKDGYLVAFHDNDLLRTTNVLEVFPENKKPVIDDFTLAELRTLDVGTWFNKKYPSRANKKYKGLTILTLEDVMKIAQGFCIKRVNNLPVKVKNTALYQYEIDPNDNGNRPGIYVETKHPKRNIEKVLANTLTSFGWNINKNPQKVKTIQGKVGIANSKARIILQSFSPESIVQLEKQLPNIPKCFLLWKPDFIGDTMGNYKKAIEHGIKYNVQIIGSSIAGAPNNYEELTDKRMVDLVHNAKMIMHPYTFDTEKQLNKYGEFVDGVFTNRADLALKYYQRNPLSAKAVLLNLGYN